MLLIAAALAESVHAPQISQSMASEQPSNPAPTPATDLPRPPTKPADPAATLSAPAVPDWDLGIDDHHTLSLDKLSPELPTDPILLIPDGSDPATADAGLSNDHATEPEVSLLSPPGANLSIETGNNDIGIVFPNIKPTIFSPTPHAPTVHDLLPVVTVPEPGASAMMLLGAAVFLRRDWRGRTL
jgi:hypothetical protein